MRFFITFFCFVGIACFAGIAQAEPIAEKTDENKEWKQIEKELNSDWDIDVQDILSLEDEVAEEKEEPKKAESSKLWLFVSGFILGKSFK